MLASARWSSCAAGPAARATAERSLALALSGPEEHVLRAYANLALGGRRATATLPLAERYLEAATAYANDPRLDLWWIYLIGFRARTELDQGRWDDAAETAAMVVRRPPRLAAAAVIALAS